MVPELFGSRTNELVPYVPFWLAEHAPPGTHQFCAPSCAGVTFSQVPTAGSASHEPTWCSGREPPSAPPPAAPPIPAPAVPTDPPPALPAAPPVAAVVAPPVPALAPPPVPAAPAPTVPPDPVDVPAEPTSSSGGLPPSFDAPQATDKAERAIAQRTRVIELMTKL